MRSFCTDVAVRVNRPRCSPPATGDYDRCQVLRTALIYAVTSHLLQTIQYNDATGVKFRYRCVDFAEDQPHVTVLDHYDAMIYHRTHRTFFDWKSSRVRSVFTVLEGKDRANLCPLSTIVAGQNWLLRNPSQKSLIGAVLCRSGHVI